jgi:hypothetical protein
MIKQGWCESCNRCKDSEWHWERMEITCNNKKVITNAHICTECFERENKKKMEIQSEV